MPLVFFALLVLVILSLGYRFYSQFLARKYDLDDRRTTPAVELEDGVDFVPTSKPILLAQHFSAIAAAGPIVGPILAGIWFGWLPAILWIVLGNIFIGAVHDFSTLVASVRHRARSVAELMREHLSRRAYLLYISFIWISLIYVIIAFADLTAQAFVEPGIGPGVASSSFMYLGLAVLMGLVLRFWKLPLWLVTLASLSALAVLIWGGQFVPLSLGPKPWATVILAYCFLASILPMWLLLQPRGYLGGWFLFVALGIAVVGIALGGYRIEYPAFVAWTNPKGLPLFPLLFITIACGACSGFHGLVCSGTTSKQISRETHARPIGYGGMILEGVVALIALSTVMMLAPGDPALKVDPNVLYARGIARFANVLGVPHDLAMRFGLLAFATFVYDTLDVATRLARYILQELTGWAGRLGAVVATLITLTVPGILIWVTQGKAYLRFWSVFGASNQLLAALSLLAIALWLHSTARSVWFALVPMAFVMVMTFWTLILQARNLDAGGITAIILLIVAVLIGLEALRLLRRLRPQPARGENP